MKSPIRLVQFGLLSLVIIASCKKSSNNNSSNDRMTLITSSAWKYDTVGLDLDRNGTIDYGDTVSACYKDNTYLFNKDSTGVANNGTVKCDDSEAQTVDFTWSFTGTNQSMIKSDAVPELENGVNIFALTSTKLVLYKDTSILGNDVWYIVQMKH